MLAEILERNAALSEVAIVTDNLAVRWNSLAADAKSFAINHADLSGTKVSLAIPSSPEAFTALFGLSLLGCHVFLVSGDVKGITLDDLAGDFGWAYSVFPHDDEFRIKSWKAGPLAKAVDPGLVTILTSGTTGSPKAVTHTWGGLARPVRRMPAGERPCWLLTFRPHLYAGLQVILQCFANGGKLVLPRPGASASDVARLAATAGVQFGSATASYWRWLLAMAEPSLVRAIPLRQITLGGEVVDQPTLDALQSNFPDARIVHIYATTELGRCFSVTDGKAGFPTSYLSQKSADGVEMKIEAGELVVRSANAMAGYEGQEGPISRESWVHTGDIVKVQGERIFFAGRNTDMINVGGQKVYPAEIEAVIREVPGVADARVFGSPSSLVGQIVACDIVISNTHEGSQVQQSVQETCRRRLATHQRPRLITLVDKLSLTEAGKVARR